MMLNPTDPLENTELMNQLLIAEDRIARLTDLDAMTRRIQRFEAATAAMQGLLPTYPRSSEHVSVALHAVQAADALLAELDREVVS